MNQVRIVTFTILQSFQLVSTLQLQLFFLVGRTRRRAPASTYPSPSGGYSGYLTFRGDQPTWYTAGNYVVRVRTHIYIYILSLLLLLYCCTAATVIAVIRRLERSVAQRAGARGARDDRPLHDDKNMTITVVIRSRRQVKVLQPDVGGLALSTRGIARARHRRKRSTRHRAGITRAGPTIT